MLTPRIEQLKKQFFTHVPAVCLEGALSKTHVFKETEGEPMIVRRAKAFKRHCETKTITIQPGELIVGNAGRTARTIHICPELSNNWVYEELDTMATRPQDPYAITEEQKMLFRNEIYPYWKGKTLRDYWNAQAPKPILDNLDAVLDRAAGKLTVRLPLIPGLNDDEGHLENFARAIKALGRVHAVELLPYHRLGKNKYALLGRTYALESLGPMSKEDLARRAAFVAERLGGTKVLF